MKAILDWLWRNRVYFALSLFGAMALLAVLYVLSGRNAGDVPFFYTTR